jgi:hypothetical protein
MFDFNFLQNQDVWGQYSLMIIGALVFGSILGFAYGNNRIRGLKVKLSKLDRDLLMWQKQLHDTRQEAVLDNEEDSEISE